MSEISLAFGSRADLAERRLLRLQRRQLVCRGRRLRRRHRGVVPLLALVQLALERLGAGDDVGPAGPAGQPPPAGGGEHVGDRLAGAGAQLPDALLDVVDALLGLVAGADDGGILVLGAGRAGRVLLLGVDLLARRATAPRVDLGLDRPDVALLDRDELGEAVAQADRREQHGEGALADEPAGDGVRGRDRRIGPGIDALLLALR
jgi:hypothetical protein